jgi:hypothetical protein
MIDANAVQADQLATDAVTTAKILAGNVTLAKIVDATAGYTILAKANTGSGDFAELAAGTDSVLRRDGSGDLAFGTIDTNHIGADQVKNANLDSTDGSEAVSTDTIQDSAVTALKLAANAVTSDKILADNVTLAKLEHRGANTVLANATGSTGALTEVTIGSNEVLCRGGGNITSSTVTNAMLAGSITGSKLSTGTIGADQLGADCVKDSELDYSEVKVYGNGTDAKDGYKIYIQSSEPAHGAAGNIWLQT